MPTIGSVNQIITANGVYTLWDLSANNVTPEGEKFLRTSGTPDGETVSLEFVNKAGDSVEFDATNTTWANTVGGNIFTAISPVMQLNVTNAGANTAVAVEFGDV